MAEHNRTQHHLFVELVCFGLNHQHGLLGTGYNQIQAAVDELGFGGVEYVLAVDIADARSADRTIEGQPCDRQRSRRAQQRRDVRINFRIAGHHRADHLHLVVEAFRKQRTDRAVDQSANQGFLLGRLAFTLEEATGDLAGRVGFFDVVDGQGEEVLARLGALGGRNGGKNDGVVDGDENCTGRLAGDFTSFEGYGVGAVLERFLVDVEQGCILNALIRTTGSIR